MHQDGYRSLGCIEPKKGWSLQVSDLSKTSSSQTLVHVADFFRDNRLLDSSVIAVARSVGYASLELTCELVDLGGGDGGSSTMVAWPVAWASWLVLVVAVGVLVACAVGAVVFLGGMVKDETVSSRRVEVSVRIYCYMVIIGG